MDTLFTFLLYQTPLFYLTQSLWRDEAFSYLISQLSIGEIILKTAQDFNPPFYYIVLHFWSLLVGQSDIGLRLLSFLFHLGTVYVSYLLGKRYLSPRWAIYVAASTFFNPMLLYYAFEMRMYALYALCAITSFYYLLQKNWKGYTIACVIGLYTHSYFLFLPLAYAGTAWIIEKQKTVVLKKILSPILFFLPWMPVLAVQFSKAQESWIFPVTRETLLSSLGNLFTSYEGTPGRLWEETALLSLIILLFCVGGMLYGHFLSRMILIPLLGPLTIILAYSILRKPIYVNRYLIPVTVFEVVGIVAGITMMRPRLLRNGIAALWLVGIIIMNLFAAPRLHPKADFKASFAEINQRAQPSDYVATTPINVLESLYYYRFPERVFIYDPDMKPIPNYIGVTLVSENITRPALPEAPSVTYHLEDDATYSVFIQQ